MTDWDFLSGALQGATPLIGPLLLTTLVGGFVLWAIFGGGRK